jgi:hypothetical protein
MVGQDFSLRYLIPLAIEHLKTDLFVEGDLFPGDLLKNVLSVDRQFWIKNNQLWTEINDIFGLSASLAFLWHGFSQPHFFISVGLTAGLICFPILYLFHYKPYFSSIFLPHLETVKEAY